MRLETTGKDLHAAIDAEWDRKQIPGLSQYEMDEDCTVCPECEGRNLSEDQTRCWDCDPEEGS